MYRACLDEANSRKIAGLEPQTFPCVNAVGTPSPGIARALATGVEDDGLPDARRRDEIDQIASAVMAESKKRWPPR